MKSIVFLPARLLTETRSFYEGVLGLPLVLDQGTCLIFRAGTGYWGFCATETPMQEANRVILTLVVEDVEEWYRRLSLQKVECDGLPRENPRYRIFHFFAFDPNGYRLEIQRFLHAFDEIEAQGSSSGDQALDLS